MKYAALLSGGKDSCFNLLHCHKNGHQLVAAATLSPEEGKEELDSYLYQTVGQDAIHLVAQALDVPLYRRTIIGTAVQRGNEYGSRSSGSGVIGDETEDLYELLLNVKLQHPNVEGVSVGAILSNYQRVRVEHVCKRLSLTCLAYLWQRDQDELLAEMIEAGMCAILIKVAGIGLTLKHLGKTLAEMQVTLRKMNSLYGSHVCGEGGEYETLTLDCPLFKKRIVLSDTETVVHSDHDFATVGYLRIKNAYLEPKEALESYEIAIPPMLSEPFNVAYSDIPIEPGPLASEGVSNISLAPKRVKKVENWISIANIDGITPQEAPQSLEDEVKQCFRNLQSFLAEHSLTFSDCIMMNVLLSSMDTFAQVNAVYSTFFGTSPPARACVAVDLPAPKRVVLDCIASTSGKDKSSLHVQGISYWAPANIGPYSQAITIAENVFVSGQIGLIPSSMTLPSPRLIAMETALAQQHVSRILTAIQSGWTGNSPFLIYWTLSPDHIKAVKRIHKRRNSIRLFVAIKSLPKNALVEVQALWHTGRFPTVDPDDGEVSLQERPLVLTRKHQKYSSGSVFYYEAAKYQDTSASWTLICFKNAPQLDLVTLVRDLRQEGALQDCFNDSFHIRLFYNSFRDSKSLSLLEALFGTVALPAITPIPCRCISTLEDDDWDFALSLVSV